VEKNEAMRKQVINADIINPRPDSQGEWLAIEEIARVEVTSEDPNSPIEAALAAGGGRGWRASTSGTQTIRIVFDNPTTLHRIRLEFSEPRIERTQEFALGWSADVNGPLREIVRQQWNFSPRGSTREIESYEVNLPQVMVLELLITPDIGSFDASASLDTWRVA
jgi:hypothetical protein